MSQIIVFASGKGGTGKTTVTVNVAVALCKMNNRVLLIDCDCGMRGLDLMLGLEQGLMYDTGDVIAGNCITPDAVYSHPSVRGLYMMPAPMDAQDEIAPEVMKQFVTTLRNNYDYILIDSPAGVGSGFISAVSGADRAVIVINPEPASVRGAQNVRRELLKHGIEDIRLIINKVNEKRFFQTGIYTDLDEVIDRCETQLIGVVPEDHSVVVYSQRGSPYLNDSPVSKVFTNIAFRISGGNVQLAFPKRI